MATKKAINETQELLNILRSIKSDITQGTASKGLWPTVLHMEKALKNKIFSTREVRFAAILSREDKLLRLLPQSEADYTAKHHRIIEIIEAAKLLTNAA